MTRPACRTAAPSGARVSRQPRIPALLGALCALALGIFTPARADVASAPPGGEPPPPQQTLQSADPLARYLREVLAENPEIKAARNEVEAARQRVQPAGALEDPMLEAGVVNAPVPSVSFSREDMTMKMLGLSQKIPYPGKRDLKESVARKDAESVELAYLETVNRVVRDARVAYIELGLVIESSRLTRDTREVLKDFVAISQARYAVGQGNQSDIFKAQTALAKMAAELARLGRERIDREAELGRLVGATSPGPALAPQQLDMRERDLDVDRLAALVRADRPQLLALQKLIERATKEIDLARKEFYPDFDVRLAYGQRDATRDGVARDDMISLTLAVNLPIWRERKLMPRVAEAIAMRDQAIDTYQAQESEAFSMLRRQAAAAAQSLQSARLYEHEVLPAAALAVQASLSAYKVSRADFLTLLDSQMAKFEHELAHAVLIADYNKSLAEIDLLTGSSGMPDPSPTMDSPNLSVTR